MPAHSLPSITKRGLWVRSVQFLPAIACLLMLIPARAQVTFTGSTPSVNLGSQAVKSKGKVVSLSFSIGSQAATQVGSVAVLTTGAVDKDFVKSTGSTCKVGAYPAATSC